MKDMKRGTWSFKEDDLEDNEEEQHDLTVRDTKREEWNILWTRSRHGRNH